MHVRAVWAYDLEASAETPGHVRALGALARSVSTVGQGIMRAASIIGAEAPQFDVLIDEIPDIETEVDRWSKERTHV